MLFGLLLCNSCAVWGERRRRKRRRRRRKKKMMMDEEEDIYFQYFAWLF
jgi:uncharacterized protein YggL (DUF469 family)